MKLFKTLLVLLAAAIVMAGGWLIFDRHFREKTADNQSTETRYASDEPSPIPPFNKQRYSLSDPASPWVVVNKQHPLQPLDYVPADLVSVGDSRQRLRTEAATALNSLLEAARTADHDIKPLSGYRSYQRQKTVYQYNVDTFGQAAADEASAKPGYSEHQTGWSIDVGGGGCGIEACFGDTAEGKWLAANAYKHGFVVRYPIGKQDVTGYKYEPWHIRYVGVLLATEMHQQNIITMEEFFGPIED